MLTTMPSAIERLLAISSPPLGSELDTSNSTLPPSLAALLAARNGFYAFESALHVLPSGTDPTIMDVEKWNEPSLWRAAYADAIPSDLVFFAEDIFGEQFGIEASSGVVRFAPETATLTREAPDMESWAEHILADYDVAPGWPIARAWQDRHGPLAAGQRLVPVIPFAAGGAFGLENIHALPAAEGIRLRCDFSLQMRDVPPGTPMRIQIVNHPEGGPTSGL